ncbi:hypothetical protein [Haloterrigena alkaliphila]|uniref:PGF-CTERM protein n=1 Tax=Haloterrigena alkaliphila TaxID=2816475 RepID=A0A8A2VDI4_9EURY|nr:hypothetical protein [Haloterrigena alkaliphila]QSW98494.1 hypothetical protein J0X25_13970 [Haloterrigena alkaliphila]
MVTRSGVLVAVFVVLSIGIGDPSVAAAQEGGDSMETTTTVTEDGDIDTLEMNWKTDAATYESLRAAADKGGYETVAAWFAEERMLPAENGFEAYGDAADTELEDGYRIEVAFTQFDRSELEGLELTVEDGTVAYESTSVEDPAEDATFDEVTYVLEMPGEITDSNAHEVDGSVATWHLHEEPVDSLSATAETGSSGETGSAESLPGFGAGAAAVGALVAIAVLGRRSD